MFWVSRLHSCAEPHPHCTHIHSYVTVGLPPLQAEHISGSCWDWCGPWNGPLECLLLPRKEDMAWLVAEEQAHGAQSPYWPQPCSSRQHWPVRRGTRAYSAHPEEGVACYKALTWRLLPATLHAGTGEAITKDIIQETSPKPSKDLSLHTKGSRQNIGKRHTYKCKLVNSLNSIWKKTLQSSHGEAGNLERK